MPNLNRHKPGFKTILLGIAVLLNIGVWAEPATSIDSQEVSQASEAEPEETPAVEGEAEASDAKKWEFTLTPVVWLAKTKTDVSVGDRSRSAFMTVGDALGNFQGGGSGRLEATNGKWGGFTDLFFISLGDTTNLGPRGNIPVSIDADNFIWQVAGTYRVVNKEDFDLDILAGARGYSIDLDVNIDPFVGPAGAVRFPGRFASRSLSFVDPIIGAKANWKLSEKWDMDLYGDIGGFGVGSDFTYRTGVNFGYAANKTVSLRAGYILMDFDYSQGSGLDRATYDTTMYGPVLGAGFKF